MSSDEEIAQEISDCIDGIMEDYGHLGPVFVSSIFLNGIIQTICMGSKDENSAREATKIVCDFIKCSIEAMIELGAISKLKSNLQ
jgi:hypothetical protein